MVLIHINSVNEAKKMLSSVMLFFFFTNVKSYHTRVLLAALDYNSHLGRQLLEDKDGEKKCR